MVGDPYKWLSLHHRQIQYGDGWMDEKRAELEPRTAWFQMGYIVPSTILVKLDEGLIFQCWNIFSDFPGPSYGG